MTVTVEPTLKTHHAPTSIVDDPLQAALRRLAARTPEEITRDKEAARSLITPGRPLPDGKTLFEVIGGNWPGQETDEQIDAVLEKLS